MLTKQIPTIPFPEIQHRLNMFVEEDMVSLSSLGFFVESQYYKKNISGAYKDCYVRESVAAKLVEAQNLLPKGVRFKIYDGYRSIKVQQTLWNMYRQQIKDKYPNLSDEELDFKTAFFVSKPSLDITKPSLHNTGGAIDLTLIDENGKELNMGTDFDDFTNKSWTNHFEQYDCNEEVCQNRRTLYNAMILAGFTNLPSEWWHYDYGTKFWAHFKNTDILYGGILNIQFPNQIP